MKSRLPIALALIVVGCSSDSPISESALDSIPSPVQVPARPLLDTELTYYSYFELGDGVEAAKERAEGHLARMLHAGLEIGQAWLGTTNECDVAELVQTARLVVRLERYDNHISDFGFVSDPAPKSFEFPWVYWYGCDEPLVWRYDIVAPIDVFVPEPTQVPSDYPIPDSPTKYYRPWYVWDVTEDEWRAGVEAFIAEMIREGISLERVSVPLRPMDSCSQNEWPNTDVVIIETTAPDQKLNQLGVMTESYNSMNMCPETLWSFELTSSHGRN